MKVTLLSSTPQSGTGGPTKVVVSSQNQLNPTTFFKTITTSQHGHAGVRQMSPGAVRIGLPGQQR